MSWIWLGIAGVFEIAGALGLKLAPASGWLAMLGTAVAMLGSVGCLSLAVQRMPLGPSYAIWTGIGTVGTMAFGMAYMGEPCTLPRIAFTLCILVGIAGLRLTTAS